MYNYITVTNFLRAVPNESNDHKQLYHHDTELFMSCESFQNVQSYFANYASIWKHNLLMSTDGPGSSPPRMYDLMCFCE